MQYSLEVAPPLQRSRCEPPYSTTTGHVIEQHARRIVEDLRQQPHGGGLVAAFLSEYGLTDAEGVALMCLAESVLRIPDVQTRKRLIAEKIGGADWQHHLGRADSLFVNASTWALLWASRLVQVDEAWQDQPGTALNSMTQRLSLPVVQQAVRAAIHLLGSEFVLHETIEGAMLQDLQGGYSFDMLGEGARDAATSESYFSAYCHAIETLGQNKHLDAGISIKLSALHPRLEYSQRHRLRRELLPRLKRLCRLASQHQVAVTIDAEESWRSAVTLDLFECLLQDAQLSDVRLGIVVQAYSKQALNLLASVAALSQQHQRMMPVRLVKGAYWDSEIKHAQAEGLPSFPVFTQKAQTDLNYLSCARFLLAQNYLYGQFATHNALTIAAIYEMAPKHVDYEFQRLYGMGEDVYAAAKRQIPGLAAPRVYAPIGAYKDLLAYLIRRLLENGANTSFVHRLYDCNVSLETLLEDPVQQAGDELMREHPNIQPAEGLFQPRVNSVGLDLSNPAEVLPLYRARRQYLNRVPALRSDRLNVQQTMQRAAVAQTLWSELDVAERAQCLRRLADLLQQQLPTLVAVLGDEAHKTLSDAVAEVREAIDFCRYYAECGQTLQVPRDQPGVTGESNRLTLHGRGVWVCISPWNFPLAIFIGQIAAALVTGNSVVAKPSEFTSRIAHFVHDLLRQAGVADHVCQLAIGDATLGQQLVEHPLTAGVAFTGSTAAARSINQTLAGRTGPIIPLIAETGGQNAMLVDSTALLEEVTDDVVTSAFASAGQRCSALRMLYIQDDIADVLLPMISGAMDQLQLGAPWQLRTDVGPVINQASADLLHAYIEEARTQGKLLHQCSKPQGLSEQFVAPALIKVAGIDELAGEQFGPVLHVATFAADQFEQTVDAVNTAGFGLTMGLHTRIQQRIDYVSQQARVGNLYVNRDMVGAVVESQPFGGQGLSGTGPKAGGPFYLQRFVTERVVTVNTVAGGGNRDLLSLGSVR